jgi:hypothetical protein
VAAEVDADPLEPLLDPDPATTLFAHAVNNPNPPAEIPVSPDAGGTRE